ncbi:hypothetical protein HOLleu_42437 [Holothuria leucospilota]|uniref:LRAT domain-containing protein n=1 Tax=Holothuria leucospilota TaxID=206669 RepID=A0A9Q1BBC7_HOLLE|nr:hypothetical protein HOLleu_42437 [Holothuria leucospilota]
MDRTGAGALFSAIKFDHEDEEVSSVEMLETGDHIVLSTWMLHPRCHAIIVEKDSADDRMKVIRFTYSNGVVEEWLPFEPPVYKVRQYYTGDDKIALGDHFKANEVVRRAKSKVGNKELVYSISDNNCKTFARWCKTGIRPSSVKGYD